MKERKISYQMIKKISFWHVFKDEIYGSTFFPVTSKYMKSAGLFWRCVSFFLYCFEYKCLIKANNIQVERGENFLSNGIKSFFPQLRLWKNTEVDILCHYFCIVCYIIVVSCISLIENILEVVLGNRLTIKMLLWLFTC